MQTMIRLTRTSFALPMLERVNEPRPTARPRSSTWTRRSSRSRARWPSAARSTQGGLINRRAVLRSAYAQFVYLVGGADHDQMERMRHYLSAMATGWDVAAGQGHRRRDAARADRPDHLRRGRHPDRGAPPGRPRRRHRQHVRRRGGRADRRDARRRPRDRDPDGRRGRPLHRRDRVLRLRRDQGRRRSASSPSSRATTCAAATPTATRPPTCRCSRRSATRTRSTRTGRCAARPTPADWPVLVFSKPVQAARPHRQRHAATPTSPRGRRAGRRRGHRGHRLVRRATPRPRLVLVVSRTGVTATARPTR